MGNPQVGSKLSQNFPFFQFSEIYAWTPYSEGSGRRLVKGSHLSLEPWHFVVMLYMMQFESSFCGTERRGEVLGQQLLSGVGFLRKELRKDESGTDGD